jgi:chorismate synthase
VPHPAITVTRPREGHATWNFGDTLTVWVDGRRVGRSRSVTVRIEPDAVSVLV